MNMPGNSAIAENANAVHDLIELSSDWTIATRQLWDLRKTDLIPDLQWLMILDWLVATDFDDQSYIAGEIAYSLIRDRAPASIQNRLHVGQGDPPLCRMTFAYSNPTPISWNSDS